MSAIKKTALTAATVSLSLLTATANAEIGNGEYALGFQNGFSTAGVAARVGINDEISAEVILGFFGALSHYGVRGLYTLQDEGDWSTYAFGSTGIWTWDSSYYSETAFGVGAGAGVEWDWRSFNSSLPPITWNIELGLGLVSFDRYNFGAFSFGTGARYHF